MQVSVLETDGIDAVARMLAASFQNDPGYAALFPAEQRADGLRVLFAALLRLRLGAGATVRVVGPPEAPLGAISAAPSSVRFGLFDQLRAGLLWAPLRWGWSATIRMHKADVEAGVLRAACQPEVPHTWVAQVGVLPEHQGRGIGSTLLQAVLDEADRAEQPTALMTTASDNPGWYRRFGFREAGRRQMEAGFTTWFLVRAPEPSQGVSAAPSAAPR